MEIFLLILKVIGIILLSILGFILFVVLLVLLTPFRYHLKGKYHEGKPDVLFNFHFWFHLISAKAIYDDKGLVVKVRIFFITKTLISPDKKEKDKKSDVKEQTGEKETIETTETTEEPEKPEEAVETSAGETVETEEVETTAEEETVEDSAEDAENNDETEKVDSAEVVSEEEKSAVDKIVDKIKGLYDKLIETKDKITKKKSAIEWLLKRPETMRMLVRLKNQGIKIIKGILPRKFKGYFTLGLEDPKTMGMICMYASIFYPYGAKNFEFTPVFDEKIIDGEGELKGRIILGAILLHVLKLILCRDFFRTLKNIKKFKKLWR